MQMIWYWQQEVLEAFLRWKEATELRGLKENLEKTKTMIPGTAQRIQSGIWPCGVCGRGVGVNSILCVDCNKKCHQRCFGLRRANGEKNVQHPTCRRGNKREGRRLKKEEQKRYEFCYQEERWPACWGIEVYHLGEEAGYIRHVLDQWCYMGLKWRTVDVEVCGALKRGSGAQDVGWIRYMWRWDRGCNGLGMWKVRRREECCRWWRRCRSQGENRLEDQEECGKSQYGKVQCMANLDVEKRVVLDLARRKEIITNPTPNMGNDPPKSDMWLNNKQM